MATGFRHGGTDIEGFYAPNRSGQRSIPSGLTFQGVDMNTRFEVLSFGSRAPNLLYSGNGRGYGNISDLWAGAGTPQYNLPYAGVEYFASSFSRPTQPGSTTARSSLIFHPNGTWETVMSGDNIGGQPRSGTWLPAGRSSNDFNLFCDFQLFVNPGFSNPQIFGNSLGVWVAMNVEQSISILSSVPNQGEAFFQGGRLNVGPKIRDNALGSTRDTGVLVLTSSAQSQV